MGEDLGAAAFRIGHRPRHVTADDRAACEAQVRVAADVIAMMVCVDDVANGFGRERRDRSDDLPGQGCKLRVDDEDAVLADLHRDVAAGADQQVDVVAHVQRVDLDAFEILLRLRREAEAPQ